MVNGDGCSNKCKIEEGFSCFNSSESVNQVCEFTDYTEIIKISASNDNNIVIDFSRPVTFDRNISQLDLEITVLFNA